MLSLSAILGRTISFNYLFCQEFSQEENLLDIDFPPVYIDKRYASKVLYLLYSPPGNALSSVYKEHKDKQCELFAILSY